MFYVDLVFLVLGPIVGKTIVKEISGISDKSYRSEDETFSDAVTEFSDSGISPGLEEHPEGVKSLRSNVKRVDDELLKADSTGGIYARSMASQMCCI